MTPWRACRVFVQARSATVRPLALLVALLALPVALPQAPAEAGADGVVVRVEPWIPGTRFEESVIVKPITAVDGVDYHLWSLRVSVRQADGAWVNEPIDPAGASIRVTAVDKDAPAADFGGAAVFRVAGDATRVVVAIPKLALLEAPSVVQGSAAGRSGAFNALKSRLPAEAADALDDVPTPVLFNRSSAGAFRYSTALEILPVAGGGYDVRATPLSPFVEQTTLRTRDGSRGIVLDASAPSTTRFAGADPVGVVARSDATRFTLPGKATFGDPVARFLLCKSAVACASSIAQILSRENATANGTYSISPPGEPLAHRWDWGDGSAAAGSAARYDWKAAGVYTVTLNVTDPEGRSDEASMPLTVLNQPPRGSVTVAPSPTTRIALTTATATATDEDGLVVKYVWYVDGVRARWDTGAPSLTIPRGALALGTHTAKALFQDNGGAFGQAQTSFEVVNVVPVAAASLSKQAVRPGVPVTFTSRSADPDGAALSVAWDFGDGATGAGALVEHAFAAEGAFTPRITVTDADGGAASLALPAIIVDGTPPTLRASPPAPQPSGWYTSADVLVPFEAHDDRGGMRLFATIDGVTSELAGPSVKVSGDGVHAVTIKAVDVAGNEASESLTVKIDSENAVAEFAAPSPFAHAIERLVLSATDETSGVARLEIRVDGTLLAAQDGPGPLAADWDTRGEVYGRHAIQVRAFDVAGRATILSYNVMVLNSPLVDVGAMLP